MTNCGPYGVRYTELDVLAALRRSDRNALAGLSTTECARFAMLLRKLRLQFD